MSDPNPYEKLGVTENASFEEIQEAKKSLVQQYQNDVKAVSTIEAAYDAIIMDRLKMRQEGRIKVPDRIRFAEKAVEMPKTPAPISLNRSPDWLQGLIDNPSSNELIWPSVIFFGLIGMVILSPGVNPSVILALGFCGSIYFLNRKENRFGRALLLTFVGLLLGIGIGMGLASGINSSVLNFNQLASAITCLLFWLISSFLR
jgi:hypothetical protein